MLGLERPFHSSPFGAGEAHEDSISTGMRQRRPPETSHDISDITNSLDPTRPLLFGFLDPIV
jgi:hypothetical protein